VPIDRIFHQGHDSAVALCDDVLIQIWEGPAHNDVLKIVLGALQSLRRGPFAARKLFVLHVVAETASPPDAQGRAIAAKFLEHFDLHVNVTEGTGFRASLIRSAILGILMLSGTRAKNEVTASVDAGIDALVAAGCDAKKADLVGVVRELREALPARRGTLAAD
jgi:hypothetical protein